MQQLGWKTFQCYFFLPAAVLMSSNRKDFVGKHAYEVFRFYEFID